jgi:hypothetical protein
MVDMLFHEMYLQASVFFRGEILPNFNLKNMILTYTKGFSWKKKGPNFPDFEGIKIQISRFLW